MMKITFSCLMFNPEEQRGCNETNQQADFVFDQRFVSGRFGTPGNTFRLRFLLVKLPETVPEPLGKKV